MMAIGLAKRKGADMTHSLRYENMANNLLEVGTIAINNLNIICGVASIEDIISQPTVYLVMPSFLSIFS